MKESAGDEDAGVAVAGGAVDGQRASALEEFDSEHLFDALGCGVTIREAGGRIVYVNHAACVLLSAGREQFIGQRVLPGKFVRSDGSDLPPDEQAAVIAGRERRPVGNVRAGLLLPNGEQRWFEWTSLPLNDHYIVSTFANVTAYQPVEETVSVIREGALQSIFAVRLSLAMRAEHLPKSEERTILESAIRGLDVAAADLRSLISARLGGSSAGLASHFATRR